MNDDEEAFERAYAWLTSEDTRLCFEQLGQPDQSEQTDQPGQPGQPGQTAQPDQAEPFDEDEDEDEANWIALRERFMNELDTPDLLSDRMIDEYLKDLFEDTGVEPLSLAPAPSSPKPNDATRVSQPSTPIAPHEQSPVAIPKNHSSPMAEPQPDNSGADNVTPIEPLDHSPVGIQRDSSSLGTEPQPDTPGADKVTPHQG